jgi:hypothetical protein
MVVLDYYENKETYGRIGLLQSYGNLQSYWTITKLRKLTVLFSCVLAEPRTSAYSVKMVTQRTIAEFVLLTVISSKGGTAPLNLKSAYLVTLSVRSDFFFGCSNSKNFVGTFF